jgi:hypothetical protein
VDPESRAPDEHYARPVPSTGPGRIRALTGALDSRARAVLRPAVAEAAHRAGAGAVGLVALGCVAGLDLQVDRVAVAYGEGQRGDPSSPVRLSVTVVGGRPVPERAVPDVVARIGVDPDPVDLTDPEQARSLRAGLDVDQAARLDAEIALTAGAPPLLLPGEVLDGLPDAIARVPAAALPVVTTTWSLSSLPPERRLRFLQLLDDAAAGRPVAWVSVEGVGVAPAIPTLGDRRASGHSIVGLAILDGASVRADAVGRCWSRGRWLAWLARP